MFSNVIYTRLGSMKKLNNCEEFSNREHDFSYNVKIPYCFSL